MESVITKDILFSYFAGTCTVLQKKLIANWVKEEKNSELFFLWLCEWERKNVQIVVDVDRGIEKHRNWVKTLGKEQSASDFVPKKKSVFRMKRILIAASISLVVLLGGWNARKYVLYRVYQTSYGEIMKVTLKDGSKVILNANSQLSVPRFDLIQSSREVYLQGEASFDIVHTPEKSRFFVRTNRNMDIEVLGTEFNVYNRPSEFKVVLQRGIVQLNYTKGPQQQTLRMKPGEFATLDRHGKMRVRFTNLAQQYSDWKFHRFVFEDLTFREIGDRLEEVFGTTIVIKDQELASQIISGSFRATDAEELLDILKEAQDFSYRRNNNELIISQPSRRP